MPEPAKIRTIADLESWIERSRREPVWIFKHSLTCPISAAALDEFLAFAADGGPTAGCALIEVQTARPLSDELSRRTGVRHESPQVLLLRDGKAVWHASHWRVTAELLRGEAAAAG